MKRIITMAIVLSFGLTLFATSLKDLLPSMSEENMNRLLSFETIEEITCYGGTVTRITPLGSQGMEIAIESDAMTSGFAVAGLSFIPYPEKFRNMTEEERNLTVYNLIRSVSTMKGIKYISHMAGDKPVVLFEDSYMILDPNNKKSRIDDPVSTRIPGIYSCYAYQKDNRFGKNVYKVDFTNKENDYMMDITNYTAMKYMGIKCVDEGALHMYLEVMECDEGFVLFTMASVADRDPQVKVLFITVDLPSAFARRTTALKDWFKQRIEEY